MPICLLSLPNELVSIICGHLPNRDIKSLRLACLRLGAVAPLRLDRVFLSANPRNVDVFNAIASHDIFRKQVVEIVWDDVLLMEGETAVRFDLRIYNLDGQDFYETSDGDEAAQVYYESSEGEDDADTGTERRFPAWFDWGCQENVRETMAADELGLEMPDWTKRPTLPISECWAHYQKLLRQQHDVLESKAHVQALEDAWRLRRFPAVHTITITPAAHGRLFYPFFETPMIRAFPPGFIYPLQRGWQFSKDFRYMAEEWDDEGSGWSGFRIVTSLVARDSHDLAELRVDSFQLPTGLNVRLFDKPCRALEDFTTILARPSLQHLHLDLLVGGKQHHRQAAFTSGNLARVLSQAKLLSLSIRMKIENPFSVPLSEYHLPLRTILTPASLAFLRRFSLSGFYVRGSEVLEILADLPPTSLQTVELSFLSLLTENGFEDHNDFRSLLEHMRELPWRNVKVTIGENVSEIIHGRAVWVDVDDFLYRDGDNPFSEYIPEWVTLGFGIEKDLFNWSFERPNLESEEMKALGYRNWHKELESMKFRR